MTSLAVAEGSLDGSGLHGRVSTHVQTAMSKSMLAVRPARAGDAVELAPQLRRADRMEIRASSGRAPQVALSEGIANSRPALAVLGLRGEVVGLFGAVPHPRCPEAGIIWLLGSEELVANRLSFLRTAQHWVAQLHAYYPLLGNFIDARNVEHIRWLRWLGFRMLRRVARFGVEQRPFIEFCRALPKPSARPEIN